jgi:DNA-binding NtrC family response regulator
MTIRVLMVDDEPDAQELFRQNFRREIRKGIYRFDFAQSGQQALEILVNMPGMSGMELLEEVHRTWPDVGVFMITAYGDAATESRSKELGASSFFSKPVDFSRLKDDLARAVGMAV